MKGGKVSVVHVRIRSLDRVAIIPVPSLPTFLPHLLAFLAIVPITVSVHTLGGGVNVTLYYDVEYWKLGV